MTKTWKLNVLCDDLSTSVLRLNRFSYSTGMNWNQWLPRSLEKLSSKVMVSFKNVSSNVRYTSELQHANLGVLWLLPTLSYQFFCHVFGKSVFSLLIPVREKTGDLLCVDHNIWSENSWQQMQQMDSDVYLGPKSFSMKVSVSALKILALFYVQW